MTMTTPANPAATGSDIARLYIVRHRSALGEWEMASRPPALSLRPFVRQYQGYRERTLQPLRRREAPSADVPLIISFGPATLLLDPRTPSGRAERRTTFVAGLYESFALVESSGTSHDIQVNLTPIGAYLFLGVSMSALTNRAVELTDILGPAGRRLVEQLYAAPDWEARFALLDATIAARLATAGEPAPGVVWAWRRLRQSGGQVSVGTLTGELGWSRKHLAARFQEQIGLPPKTLARVLRFNRATRLISRGGASLAAVAQACGYYDQAHLTRDFSALAGLTPSEYPGRLLPDGGGLSGR